MQVFYDRSRRLLRLVADTAQDAALLAEMDGVPTEGGYTPKPGYQCKGVFVPLTALRESAQAINGLCLQSHEVALRAFEQAEKEVIETMFRNGTEC